MDNNDEKRRYGRKLGFWEKAARKRRHEQVGPSPPGPPTNPIDKIIDDEAEKRGPASIEFFRDMDRRTR